MALRSTLCAWPSLRIKFIPMILFIRPFGCWELKTPMFFSLAKMSSRRANRVAFNCGTKAMGVSARSLESVG